MAGPHEPRGNVTVPFWVHQVVELLLGIMLLVQGARTEDHAVVLLGLGGGLLVLTLCSDGALSAWPWIGRRLHRVLDLLAAGVLAASPFLLGLDDAFVILLVEGAAFAMVWLAFRTTWTTRSRRAPARTPVDPPSGSPAPESASGVPLARKVGAGVARARDEGPRQLGRLVGRARRATKAACSPPDDADPGNPGDPGSA